MNDENKWARGVALGKPGIQYMALMVPIADFSMRRLGYALVILLGKAGRSEGGEAKDSYCGKKRKELFGCHCICPSLVGHYIKSITLALTKLSINDRPKMHL